MSSSSSTSLARGREPGMRDDWAWGVAMTSSAMNIPTLLGDTPVIAKLKEEISAAASCDAKVLITGESGAGKELAAHLVHAESERRSGPFLAINCAAITDSLLESELFGHVRGSFTGAFRDRTGLLESAHRGTLLLDEVGEMSLRMQGLLLRFLETGEIQRIGDDRPTMVRDVRVIAATNVNVLDAIGRGAFRRDLYYRLNVILIAVPPLREHKDDVPLLVRHFIAEAMRAHRVAPPVVSDEAMSQLIEYGWPGNIRELRNVVERLAIRFADRTVEPHDLPGEIACPSYGKSGCPLPSARPRSAEALLERMVRCRVSFWSAVYDPFMLHDVTRDDVTELLRLGLERTRGSLPGLLQLFNLPMEDMPRLLGFLRKHHCVLPQHRTMLKPPVMARKKVVAAEPSFPQAV